MQPSWSLALSQGDPGQAPGFTAQQLLANAQDEIKSALNWATCNIHQMLLTEAGTERSSKICLQTE